MLLFVCNGTVEFDSVLIIWGGGGVWNEREIKGQ